MVNFRRSSQTVLATALVGAGVHQELGSFPAPCVSARHREQTLPSITGVMTSSQPDSQTQRSSTKASHSGQLLPEGEAEGARTTWQAEGYTKEDTSTGSSAGSRAETQRPRPFCTGPSLRHPGPGNGPMDEPLRGLTGLACFLTRYLLPDSRATS